MWDQLVVKSKEGGNLANQLIASDDPIESFIYLESY